MIAQKKSFSLAVERPAREKLRSPLGDRNKVDINELSSKIIGAAIEVHKALGPGLLEFYLVKLNAYKLRVCWILGQNNQISHLIQRRYLTGRAKNVSVMN